MYKQPFRALPKFSLLKPLAWLLLCLALSTTGQAMVVQANVMFKGGAFIKVDNTQYRLDIGESTPEGVKLLSATTKHIVIEVGGEQHTVNLTERLLLSGGARSSGELRINPARGGQYLVQGRLNGKDTMFRLDQDSNEITISSSQAKEFGIDYRKGRPAETNDDLGALKAWHIRVDKVEIDGLVKEYLNAQVVIGSYPAVPILGRPFLRDFKVRMEGNDLIITQAGQENINSPSDRDDDDEDEPPPRTDSAYAKPGFFRPDKDKAKKPPPANRGLQ